MRISKLIGAVAGVIMTLAGLGLTVAGGVALAIPDDNGWVSVGPARVRSDAAALVGDDIHIDLDKHIGDGRTIVTWDAIATEITVEDRNGKSVFVGVGPSSDVAAYLSGASVAYAEWDNDEFDVDGYAAGSAAPNPLDQDFWVATGVDGVLDWDAGDGEWSIVLVNADGSPGIDVAVSGAARIPFLGAIGAGLLIAGLLFLAGGITLTYFGVRAVPDRPTAPATPPAVAGTP